RIVLSMYRARSLDEKDAPELFGIVRELAAEAGIPVPRLYIIPSAAANAFATGRDPRHAAVAVTHGIVKILNREELKGVLAHELAHVEHRDILISSVAATLAGVIGMLASMARWSLYLGGGRRNDERSANPLALLMMAILMPIAASLIQLAVSRSREYEADRRGAHVCGNPLYLASALRKLESAAKEIPLRDAEPATAHLFIVSPLRGIDWARLFMTHPPLEERIARLEEMARGKGF
ncbi:MAG: protease HtpX, partial [Omnitrophica bacterium GWA2_52_8]